MINTLKTSSIFASQWHRTGLILLAAMVLSCASTAFAQKTTGLTDGSKTAYKSKSGSKASRAFYDLADDALRTMKQRAEELKIKGVALVAFFEGDSIQSWSSKMVVVGSLKNEPKANDRGANLLGIAYAKAAEMADTLKDSGSGVRPPMTGEFGWQGGLILKVKTGYIIAAFSGGPSESDVKVSRAGLDVLAPKLR